MKHLKIPNMPWTSISMDFIVGLPQSGECNTIWVVVDRLTKMAHFIPCKGNITAKGLVFMFIKHIFRLHGLPEDIVSDRGSLFTSNFRKSLLSLLNIKLNMSTISILKLMVKQNAPTRSSNNISDFISTINRTIGYHCFL
ncbi:hypothetical protein G6F37_009552 [Rhizopus arrhizus]|nr:hypothetical protein G6F38_009976 [Rhizopus arrhizus]KAG1154327.1 hypothetical protein G6F37_009552 [Rhizopus arrhizus]